MAYNEADSGRRKAWLLIAEKHKREAEARRHGPFTQNPEPPGDPNDWRAVVDDEQAFAAAGLCELWRMDLEDGTAFYRFIDFPPDFNFSGMWWRLAS